MPALDTPLISVIIPCYNQAHFLSEAIESVLEQTYCHFEIVVVDDESSDHPQEIVSRYQQARYFSQRNQGVSAARNSGARVSQGDCLVFLDADDWLLPKALEEGVNCLREHPACGMVFGNYQIVDNDRQPLAIERQRIQEQTDYAAFLRGNQVGMVATMLCRRAAFEAVGGFDPQLRVCEDYDFYLRLVRQHTIVRHPHLVALYRQHSVGLSRNSALMLATINQLYDAQQAALTGPDAETAWREGRQWMRDVYGWRLIAEVERDLKELRSWPQAGRGMRALLRHYPDGLFSIVRDKIRRRKAKAVLPESDSNSQPDANSSDSREDKGSIIKPV